MAAGAVTYVHSLADPAQIRRFQALGVGVYSDDPFPASGRRRPGAGASVVRPGRRPAARLTGRQNGGLSGSAP